MSFNSGSEIDSIEFCCVVFITSIINSSHVHCKRAQAKQGLARKQIAQCQIYLSISKTRTQGRTDIMYNWAWVYIYI